MAVSGAEVGHDCPTWEDVAPEVDRAVGRLRALLAAVPDPRAPAVGVWSVAETAAHLSQVWALVPLLVRGDLDGALRAVPATGGLGTPSGSVFPDIASLSDWTRSAVDAEPERDPVRLGERVAERAAAFLAGDHDEGARPWVLDGVRGDPAFFGCHVLGEMLVHGDDIARAAGVPWPLEPRAAALVVRGFLFDVFCQGLVPIPPELPPSRIDLHLSGNYRFHLVRDTSGIRIEPPSRHPVDAHLRTDPAGLLALIWRRRTTASVLMRGQLLVWGRRPWRVRELLALAPQV